jgi:predicted metal-dependent phosphoesterase TrpH
MLIDLHTHTRPLSFDSFLTVDDLIARSKATGIDGICLSEHDNCWDREEVAKLSRRHNFLVLPAIEVGTYDGHILCFGIHKHLPEMNDVAVLAKYVEAAGGVMVAAHPFRGQMIWNPKSEAEYIQSLQKAACNPAYQYCDALEALNGRGTVKENAFSIRLVDHMGVHGTAGTDSHQLSDVGKCATEFERRIETLDDLIVELKHGRFKPACLVPPGLITPALTV